MKQKVIFVLILILYCFTLTIMSGCSEYDKWTNENPKVTSFNVPSQVEYGDIVTFSVRAVDPNDDELTYLWDVSAGTLHNDAGPEVKWTAPPLPTETAPPPIKVAVDLYIDDGKDGDLHRSGTINVYSIEYNVAIRFTGVYTLVRTQVNGDPIDKVGTMNLTTTTFTREFPEDDTFTSGSYKFIEPYDERKGTIHWIPDIDPTPVVSTYTWNGKQLIISFPDTSTQYVYERTGDVEELPRPETEPNMETIPKPDPKPESDLIDKPIKITDDTFNDKVLAEKLPVVVEFMADWCPFCKQMIPIVGEAASEQKGNFIIGKLGIDDNPNSVAKYKVDGIPTYIIFKNGEVANSFAGAMPKELFVQRILDVID